jgi:ethanolamine utilization protein EutN
MQIGKIIGNVWADKKVPQLKSCRLHIVQPLTSAGKATGRVLVVADPGNLGGPGDIVVYVTGTDAIQAFPSADAAVNASVVELVDSID